MEASSAEFSYMGSFSERMDCLTPRSSRYASSTDLTDTNTSIDQIDYWFFSSPRFPSMDDILADSDAICSHCRPEYENFKSQMLSKVSDLRIQFEAFQKIQNDVEEQLWDAWEDNHRYLEEIANLKRKLALKEASGKTNEIILKEPSAITDTRGTSEFLSRMMVKITEEMADLGNQPENCKEKEVLNTALKILEKRTKALEARKRAMGNLAEKCAFLLRSGHGNLFQCHVTRSKLIDANEIFSERPQKDVYILKGDADQDESIKILQFDPNFEHSHVQCSFTHCNKSRHHLTPSKSPNSSMIDLSNNNFPKRPLYLCPKHRKQLREELGQLLIQTGVDHNSFPKSASKTCEDPLEIITALHEVCSAYFKGERNNLKQTELFINCRNFLITVDALVLPCSHSEYQVIHQFLCVLFLHLNDSLTQDLNKLVHDYIQLWCNFYGIRFHWVTLYHPSWYFLNPGVVTGAGIGAGVLRHAGIWDFKGVGVLGFCTLFCSAVWESLISKRLLKVRDIGRLTDEQYSVIVQRNDLQIAHRPHILIKTTNMKDK